MISLIPTECMILMDSMILGFILIGGDMDLIGVMLVGMILVGLIMQAGTIHVFMEDMILGFMVMPVGIIHGTMVGMVGDTHIMEAVMFLMLVAILVA